MSPLKKKSVRRTVREPERTRARILEAAFAEFAAKGFAGARVSEIARRAASNKRMLYHYFTDKKGLFRAVMRDKVTARQALAAKSSGQVSEDLPRWFAANCQDAGWIRLLSWESLQTERNEVAEEEARRAAVAQSLERARQQQASGQVDSRWDPRLYLLAMASLTTFPVAYAQITRLITNQPLNDPDFQRDYAAFLQDFTASFRPNPPRPE